MLTWNACIGGRYRVQYAAELPAASWTNLGDEIVAASSTVTASDPLGSAPQHFYRILRVN